MITVAVCIPTYCRPALLQHAVESCLQQTRLPDEILIGDDSSNDETEYAVNQLQRKTHVPIEYFHNRPGRGQARNINSLYARVRCSHLMLLHDDDMLLPNAVSDLASCWDDFPELTAAYGKQYSASEEGVINYPLSEELNRAYYRTPDREGMQAFSFFPVFGSSFRTMDSWPERRRRATFHGNPG